MDVGHGPHDVPSLSNGMMRAWAHDGRLIVTSGGVTTNVADNVIVYVVARLAVTLQVGGRNPGGDGIGFPCKDYARRC
jgi:hypothetical protein